ncbi:clostripain-related cysteine peptidase [Sphingobacterium sp. UBA6645]|uniref:clostripain-related cysteine peptidase n=1 Tax=Sphingobacterium sp. UBA6645 TaxID=1947511 RepID=UPI0025E7A38C|nr:clostripain-related cysteine peptidase [Sphingobacterium sp. UBA6645]
MFKIWLYRLFAVFILAVLISCKKEPHEIIAERTILLYMAANNNLAGNAYDNINQMEEGFRNIDGALIVYAKIFGQSPRIYRISYDNSREIKSAVLKSYPDHDSSDPKIMKMVMDDMQKLAPAKSYGLVLWSHASNWLPGTSKLKTRSFGDDDGRTMDIKALKSALPTNLDFLVFDACSMASVEVLYELKDITPLVLASPTEIINTGMPYHQVLNGLFHDNIPSGLREVAIATYEYYNEKDGILRSATFSLIDMKQLEMLAETTKLLISEMNVKRVRRDGIQRLDLDRTSPISAFDFLDFGQRHLSFEAAKKLEEAIDKVVLFKIYTTHFLGVPLKKFSGLSCYIPDQHQYNYSRYYKSLNWTKKSGFNQLFWWER